MSKNFRNWTISASFSTVSGLYKRAEAGFRSFARRFTKKPLAVRQENPREAVLTVNVSHASPIDFSGKPQELSEFIKVLRIGDRIRVFCDDGIILAEKVSQTQFKEIHAEAMAKFVH